MALVAVVLLLLIVVVVGVAVVDPTGGRAFIRSFGQSAQSSSCLLSAHRLWKVDDRQRSNQPS